MRIFLSFLTLFCAISGAFAQKTAGGPCALLTKAEIDEAVGVAVSDGVLNSTNKLVCDYKAGAGGTVGVLLTDKGPADSAEKVVAELTKRKMKAELAPGIGDGAYYSAPGYGMQQFGAFKGSKHVVVTVLLFGAPEAKAKAATEKLARKAVSKL
jgi:hypothetical protein